MPFLTKGLILLNNPSSFPLIISAPLKIGDKIKIKSAEKEVEIVVKSMQIDRKPVKEAKKGDEIGLLVPEPVHKENKVFKA